MWRLCLYRVYRPSVVADASPGRGDWPSVSEKHQAEVGSMSAQSAMRVRVDGDFAALGQFIIHATHVSPTSTGPRAPTQQLPNIQCQRRVTGSVFVARSGLGRHFVQEPVGCTSDTARYLELWEGYAVRSGQQCAPDWAITEALTYRVARDRVLEPEGYDLLPAHIPCPGAS